MLVYVALVSSYLFIGAAFGVIVNSCFTSKRLNGDHEQLAALSSIFWPIAINIWAGYYFAKYIIKKIKNCR